jgi:hypothetical protein
MTFTIHPGMRRVASKATVLALVMAGLFYSTIAVAQDYRGTSDQRMACTPDAFRLCAAYIPDAGGVENCLKHNMPNLSPACRSVFGQGIRSTVSINDKTRQTR